MTRTGERAGSLLDHLDRTRTPMGARLLREWVSAPFVKREDILAHQQAVAALVAADEARRVLHDALRRVRDVERLTSRLPMGRVNGRDLNALGSSLNEVPRVKETLAAFESQILREIDAALDEPRLIAIADKIASAIVDDPPMTVKEGGVICADYDAGLDELRSVCREGVDWIANFQEQEAKRTGIPNLKVGYNRVFGYYIEVTHTHREKIPVDYTRKQTLKNAERYITSALKEQENRVLGARERCEQLEYELFQKLRAEIESEILLLQDTGHALARLDTLLALATVSGDEDYVAPDIVEEALLKVKEGRHPVLSAGLRRSDFTPNDIQIGAEDGLLAIITGPNMAGKSTYIRQAALITILAQMGCFVPAASAQVGITDRIFTRVGAADDLTRGQSTFMVEMIETANILNNASDRSLVILDEVGRGTSTLDGVSLAWSVAEHLVSRIRARTLFATHYHELIELEEHFPESTRNLNVAVREWQDEIVFLHKILPGGTDKAYGIHVARLAGIPPDVLSRAKDILSHLERERGPKDILSHLERERGHDASSPGVVPISKLSSGTRQLDLFGHGYERLDRMLREITPDETTPLEALRILVELRKLLP
ncbi:MAG: DNA mismatch repair protein MutS [Planctomycetota bacterium]